MKQLKGFSQFIYEAKGFSPVVKEYADLCLSHILQEIEKKGSESFKKLITIPDAYLEVSREAQKLFPIDEVVVRLQLKILNETDPMQAHGDYTRGYDKIKHVQRKGEDIKVTVTCVIELAEGYDKENFEAVMRETEEILYHEFTHALNDYKEKNFDSTYKLGYMSQITSEMPEIKNLATLRAFFMLLYALTDQEMKAISGGRESFKDQDSFNEYKGTYIANVGRQFDAEEWWESLERELEESRSKDTLKARFGQLFLSLYDIVEKSRKDTNFKTDESVKKIKPTSTPLDVFKIFEPHINQRAEALWKKLAKKIETQ